MKDLNTPEFWDNKIKRERRLLEKDSMTKDRIRSAFSFIPKNKKIALLDIGAGYGFIEEYLSECHNIKIFGNDISNEAINSLKKRFKGHFKKESIYGMNHKEDSFDVILALEVLEHIPKARNKQVLDKIIRILKNNGLFILSVPINEGINLRKHNPNAHMRAYTEKILRKELADAGFVVEHVKELIAFRRMYHFKKILSKLFKNKWKPNNIIVAARKI